MSPLFRSEQVGSLTVEPDIGRAIILTVPHPHPEVQVVGEADPGVRLDEADIQRLRELCDEALS